MTIDDRLRAAAEELRRATAFGSGPELEGRPPRRGWRAPVAAAAAMVVVVGLLVALTSRGTPSVSVSTNPAASGSAFQNAIVTSAVSWKGHLLAAGTLSYQPCSVQTGGACQSDAPGSHAAVWTAAPSGSWSRAWTSPDVIDRAEQTGVQSTPVSHPIQVTLIVASHRLYLFSSWMNLVSATPAGATYLWTSTDGSRWQPVALPEGLAQHPLLSAVYGHNRLVAVSSSGVLSRLTATAWVSTDGAVWRSSSQGLEKFTAVTASLAVTPRGFVLGGGYNPPGQPAVWASADGTRWAATTLTSSPGYVTQMATYGPTTVAVARETPTSTAGLESAGWQIFVSRNDQRWTAASTSWNPPGSGTADLVVATAKGFVAVIGSQPTLWFSNRAGTAWTAQLPPQVPQPASSAVIDTMLASRNGRLLIFGHQGSSDGNGQPWIIDVPAVAGDSG